jgi:mannose-6-phosphate isomerase-like protein (cupin superfamily)
LTAGGAGAGGKGAAGGAAATGARRRAGTATRADAVATFESEGCGAPRDWANGPGDRYGRHEHAFHKVLFCLEGSIVFHTDQGEVELTAGDRLDLAPGTAHAATVGTEGCACIEASR